MPENIEVVHFKKNGRSVSVAGTGNTNFLGPESDAPIIRKKPKVALRSRKSLATVDPQCNRSVQMQVSHAEITHDEAANAEVVDPDSQFALPTNLLATAVLHILLGSISLSICMVLYFANSIIEVYLEASHSHTHSPAFFVFISEVLTILAGFGLIGCLLFNLKSFYWVYPHLLWIIVMFDLVAIMFSFGSWRYLNMSTYARMFESESMIFCEGNYEYYNILWNRPPNSRDPEPRLWGKLESTLRCCGYHQAEDWPKVCNGKVPLTCCRKSLLTNCHQKLRPWNAGGGHTTDPLNITSIRHLLYQRSCVNVLSLEANSIQRDWIVFPFIIALFDLILMINGNHKAKEICFKLQTPQGRKELTQFRIHCWNKLKCKSTKVRPLRSEDESLHSPPGSRTHTCGFVTDRESVQGLDKTESSSEGFLPNNASSASATVNPQPIPFKKGI